MSENGSPKESHPYDTAVESEEEWDNSPPEIRFSKLIAVFSPPLIEATKADDQPTDRPKGKTKDSQQIENGRMSDVVMDECKERGLYPLRIADRYLFRIEPGE